MLVCTSKLSHSPGQHRDHFCRRTQGQTSFIFYAWQQHTRQEGRNNRVASQHLQQVQQGLVQSVFASWHQHAAKQRHYASRVRRCKQLRHRILLQTGLQAFTESAQLRRAQDQIVQKSAGQVKVRSYARVLDREHGPKHSAGLLLHPWLAEVLVCSHLCLKCRRACCNLCSTAGETMCKQTVHSCAWWRHRQTVDWLTGCRCLFSLLGLLCNGSGRTH